MIDVVLLLVVSICTSVLILEDLGQDALVLSSLICPVQVHAPTMNSVELVLDVA